MPRFLKQALGRAGGILLSGFFLFALSPFLATSSTQFTSRVETVLMRVGVQNSAGNPVGGLAASDFRISVDGKPQEISYFEAPGGPMTVLLVFDASSSMEGESSQFSIDAARQFIRTLSTQDEVGLVQFDHQAELVLKPEPSLERMEQALGKLESEGGTALYDGIQLGYSALESSDLSRQVLFVLSDGLEQDSTVSFATLENLAAGRNVVFSSISWLSEESRNLFERKGKYYKEPEFEENLNPVWVLRRLANVSGGETLFPAHKEELLDQLKSIAGRLRTSYLVGFQPDPDDSKDRLRLIEVELPDWPQARIEHREGFRALPHQSMEANR